MHAKELIHARRVAYFLCIRPSYAGRNRNPVRHVVQAMGTREPAPGCRLPDARLLTIEYPGRVRPNAASFDRALGTMCPYAGPVDGLQSVGSALEHLASVLELGGKVVECRLASNSERPSSTDFLRHPVLGDIVDVEELVMRVRRRTWKYTPVDGGVPVLRKEYIVELLGAADKCVRFRRMADFAYNPGPSADPTLALHAALVRMDVEAMRSYQLPARDEGRRGCVGDASGMIPPPFFSRVDLPFAYKYVLRRRSQRTDRRAATGKTRHRACRRCRTPRHQSTCVGQRGKAKATSKRTARASASSRGT